MLFGNITKANIRDMVDSLMKNYLIDLDDAYKQAGDDALDITFKVKVKPGRTGNDITVSMSFIKEKVKDKVSTEVSEHQQNLPFEEQAA